MDDAELTELALEIFDDVPELELDLCSDASTEANVDTTDSFIINLADEYHNDHKYNDEVEIISHSPPNTPPLDPNISNNSHPPILFPFSPEISPSDARIMVKSILLSPSHDQHRLKPQPPHAHIRSRRQSKKHKNHKKHKQQRKHKQLRRTRPSLKTRSSLPAIHEVQRSHSVERRVSLIPDFSVNKSKRSKTLTSTHRRRKPMRNSEKTYKTSKPKKRHRKTQSFGGHQHHHGHKNCTCNGQTLLRSRDFRRRTEIYFKGDKSSGGLRQRSLPPVTRTRQQRKKRGRATTDDILKNKEYAVETSYGFEFAVYSSCDESDSGVFYHKY